MKIVKILGGLGNQMFQYALFLSLKELFPNERVMIDISCFKGYTLHNGFEIDRIFAQKPTIASWKDILKVAYPYQNYRLWQICKHVFPKRKTMYIEQKRLSLDTSILLHKGDCYYDGYWQHEEYFYTAKESILKAFSFPEITNERNKETTIRIQMSNSVSLHVRRGDYINHKLYRGICDIEYYKRAIQYIEKHVQPQLYCIFSNDTEWCKNSLQELLFGKEVIYVDWNRGAESFIDMQLMSLCSHNIIANSSFSWWGAWLNQHPDKIVISPTKWINAEVEDPIPKRWIKL